MNQVNEYTSITVFPETREIVREMSRQSGMRISCLVDRMVKEYCKNNRY